MLDFWKLAYLKVAYGYRRSVIKSLKALLFKKKDQPQKIVVHRVGAFGDSVVALPAISLLRAFYSKAQIDLVSTQAVGITIKDLIEGEGVVDNVYVFARGERRKALELIRQGEYDLYVEIPQNLNLIKTIRNMLFVRFGAKIPYAFGWDAGRIKRFLPLQKSHLEIPREVDRFIRSLGSEGISGSYQYPLAIQKHHLAKAEACVEPTDRKRVAFLIGGKLQAKKWPLENWSSLAALLQTDFDIYLLGGPDEVEEGRRICDSVPVIHNLCGQTSVLETAAILSKVDLAISQDTGAMHLAYAVGTPLVSIFSTRDLSNKWFPPADSSVVLERVLPCSFCFKSECADNICMTDITVEDVLRAKEALEKKICAQHCE